MMDVHDLGFLPVHGAFHRSLYKVYEFFCDSLGCFSGTAEYCDVVCVADKMASAQSQLLVQLVQIQHGCEPGGDNTALRGTFPVNNLGPLGIVPDYRSQKVHNELHDSFISDMGAEFPDKPAMWYVVEECFPQSSFFNHSL